LFVSLELFNFPGRFIRHQNFLGELMPIQSDLDRNDRTRGSEDLQTGSAVSFRPVNFPTFVLRHQDFRIKLSEFNPPLVPPPPLAAAPEQREIALLREDSTFFVRQGLAEANAFSFASSNFPGRFITNTRRRSRPRPLG
jgi:Alpha-L-arabinofuranosidase B (ABFB) domain